MSNKPNLDRLDLSCRETLSPSDGGSGVGIHVQSRPVSSNRLSSVPMQRDNGSSIIKSSVTGGQLSALPTIAKPRVVGPSHLGSGSDPTFVPVGTQMSLEYQSRLLETCRMAGMSTANVVNPWSTPNVLWPTATVPGVLPVTHPATVFELTNQSSLIAAQNVAALHSLYQSPAGAAAAMASVRRASPSIVLHQPPPPMHHDTVLKAQHVTIERGKHVKPIPTTTTTSAGVGSPRLVTLQLSSKSVPHPPAGLLKVATTPSGKPVPPGPIVPIARVTPQKQSSAPGPLFREIKTISSGTNTFNTLRHTLIPQPLVSVPLPSAFQTVGLSPGSVGSSCGIRDSPSSVSTGRPSPTRSPVIVTTRHNITSAPGSGPNGRSQPSILRKPSPFKRRLPWLPPVSESPYLAVPSFYQRDASSTHSSTSTTSLAASLDDIAEAHDARAAACDPEDPPVKRARKQQFATDEEIVKRRCRSGSAASENSDKALLREDSRSPVFFSRVGSTASNIKTEEGVFRSRPSLGRTWAKTKLNHFGRYGDVKLKKDEKKPRNIQDLAQEWQNSSMRNTQYFFLWLLQCEDQLVLEDDNLTDLDSLLTTWQQHQERAGSHLPASCKLDDGPFIEELIRTVLQRQRTMSVQLRDIRDHTMALFDHRTKIDEAVTVFGGQLSGATGKRQAAQRVKKDK